MAREVEQSPSYQDIFLPRLRRVLNYFIVLRAVAIRNSVMGFTGADNLGVTRPSAEACLGL
jgi:hypothetical protein